MRSTLFRVAALATTHGVFVALMLPTVFAEPVAQTPVACELASPATRIICGDAAVSAHELSLRIRTVRTLGRSLPAADFFTLQRFLEKPPANDVLPAAQLDSLKNDVAVKLLACEHLPDDFSRRFIAMASNDALGPVWQNYTLQLLDSLWLRDERPETRHEIIKTLTAATCDTRPTISGVALLTLSRLVEKECASTGNASPIGASPQPVPSRSELGALALAVLQRKEAPSQDKVTALAVASECGDTCAPAVLSLARKWASNKTLPGMQRITAFSVLGRHGDTRDLPILETERNSTDFRLKKASRAAIIKIQTLNRKP